MSSIHATFRLHTIRRSESPSVVYGGDTNTHTQCVRCKCVFIQLSDPSASRVQSFNFFLLIALFLIDHSCIVLIPFPHSYKVVFGHSGQTCMNKEP